MRSTHLIYCCISAFLKISLDYNSLSIPAKFCIIYFFNFALIDYHVYFNQRVIIRLSILASVKDWLEFLGQGHWTSLNSKIGSTRVQLRSTEFNESSTDFQWTFFSFSSSLNFRWTLSNFQRTSNGVQRGSNKNLKSKA